MTLFFLAQGYQIYRRRARRYSRWTYQTPGTRFFKICGQIRPLENRLQYPSKTASQGLYPHNYKGPAYQWVRVDLAAERCWQVSAPNFAMPMTHLCPY
jgi:hypothetical protein